MNKLSCVKDLLEHYNSTGILNLSEMTLFQRYRCVHDVFILYVEASIIDT